jgi:hypothetical protein
MIARRPFILGSLSSPFVIGQARAADTIKVAIFEAASTLPYFVALARGFFTEVGIAPQGFALANHPLIVQALVAGDAEACTNLVTLEGANINVRRANTVMYFTMNGQNARHQMEQFVVRANSSVTRLAELRGARILSAPGPANMAAARGVLTAVGLQDGRDYTLVEQPMGVHIGAMQSGQFERPSREARAMTGEDDRLRPGPVLGRPPQADRDLASLRLCERGCCKDRVVEREVAGIHQDHPGEPPAGVFLRRRAAVGGAEVARLFRKVSEQEPGVTGIGIPLAHDRPTRPPPGQ